MFRSEDMIKQNSFKIYFFVVAALLVFIFVMGFVSPELRTSVLKEDGPVENCRPSANLSASFTC